MKELIKEILKESTKSVGYSLPANFNIDTPPDPKFGDYASNIAMIIAKKAGEKPFEVANKIAQELDKNKAVTKAQVAGPGFINIFLSDDIYREKFEEILERKEDYGKGSPKKKKIQVEYVSANPTGPLHVGNARGGPIGESLANLYSFLGYVTQREFYVNDLGGQINRFGETLYYWYAKKIDDRIEFPEGGYPGEYMKIISETIQKEKVKDLERLKDREELIEFFKKEGLYHTIKSIREDCELIDIKFDNWINQSDILFSGKSEKVIEELEKKNATIKKEGALWFKNPQDLELEDKESVLKKSDEKGTLTYFADDIAYHADKFNRGFDKVIDVWGANHYAHIFRLKSALSALGYSDDRLQIILYQYVRLKNAGKVVSMGKRLGNFVTLRQVIESGVAPDAFKYFIISQNPNTPFDFDLALAADTSEKNPVYYIKYAHARIASIFRKAGESVSADKGDFSLLKNPKEKSLYKELIKFPEILNEISEDFQIQALPHFAYKIATLFHDFYSSCQVISEDKKLTASRLSLAMATKYVLANALTICGIEAPEKM